MKPHIKYTKGRLSKSRLKDLYIAMIRPRLIEEKMLILLRQGKISKWFSGIGQEAISIGATLAMSDDEVIEVTPYDMFPQTSHIESVTKLRLLK